MTKDRLKNPNKAVSDRPLVSIGLPVYNGEEFVADAIESVLDQSYRNLELIICDNASTDGTREICLGYAARDPRVRYHRSERNRGAARNFNWAVELATGSYFKWISADGWIEPAFVERCLEQLEADPQAVLALGRFNARCETTDRSWFLDIPSYDLRSPRASHRFAKIASRLRSPIPIWGLMRMEALRRTHLIRSFVGSDGCFVCEMIVQGRFAEVDEPLILIRVHEGRYSDIKKKGRGVEGPAEARWFNPEEKGEVFLPHWKRLKEFARICLGSDETAFGKGRMLLSNARAAIRWRGILAKELMWGARDIIGASRRRWLRSRVGSAEEL